MRKLFSILMAGLLAVLILPLTAQAFSSNVPQSDSDSSGNITVDKSTVIKDNYFTAGNVVIIEGEIQKDLFAFAQSVDLSGKVGGNVFTGANMVKIDGPVGGDVYAGAATLEIGKNAVITGDLIAGAGTVTINGKVNGKVWTGTGTLSLGSTAVIGKEIVYSSDKAAKVSPDAKIAKITQKIAPKPEKSKVIKEQITNHFLGFLMALLVGVLMLTLLAKWTKSASEQIKSHFWKTLGWGFLFLVATPLALIIALVTVIGIPLAFISGALYFIAIYLAKIIAALALGEYISKQKWLPIWSLTLGLAIIVILCALPYIGGFIGFVVLLLGLGGLVIGANTCCKNVTK